MADSRIINLPVASTIADNDSFVVDAVAAGNRQVTGLALKNFLGAQRPFSVSFAGSVVSVSAGSRLLRTGASVSFGGGTINVPDGTYWVVHLANNLLSLLTTLPVANEDILIIARVVAGAGVVQTLVRDDPLGGSMRGERNLGELADVAAARTNLGVVSTFTSGGNLTGAGDTPLTLSAAAQDTTVTYNISGSGSAAYTRSISIQSTPTPQAGSHLTLIFSVVAGTGAATIEIRQGTGGLLLATFTMGPVDRKEIISLIWSGGAWNVVASGTVPWAGAVAASPARGATYSFAALTWQRAAYSIATGCSRARSVR